MIIKSSDISMSVEHEKSTTTSLSVESSSSINYQANRQLTGFENILSQLTAPSDTDILNIDEQPQDDQNSILVLTDDGYQFRTSENDNSLADQQAYTSMVLFKRLLQAINQLQGKEPVTDIETIDHPLSITSLESTDTQVNTVAQPERYISIEMSLNTTKHIEEHESLDYSSTGFITTEDGRNISFDLSINQQRDYSYTSTSEFTQQVVFKDPLVINYPGLSADLSDEKYSFDIDADGNEEMISYFSSGAMLALDKNDDGIINDGSELFGALSGNGFADLAAYDEDNNLFIDEADSIFSQLQLWQKSADDDSLVALSAMDVGAIYLGATQTDFDFKSADNQLNGQLKSSSVYLTESGEVGNIQQVDMAV